MFALRRLRQIRANLIDTDMILFPDLLLYQKLILFLQPKGTI